MKSPSPQPHQKPLLHAKKRSQVAPRTGLRGVFFLGLLALLSLVALLPGKSGAAASLSPTGRTPKLLWTPQRQAVWNRMRAENHPFWQLIKENADKSNTPTARYGDIGDWPALAYQITGDPVYAQKALGMIFKKFEAGVATFNMDFSREWFSHYVLLYDWLYPAMTPEQRTAYIGILNAWADKRTTNPHTPNFPIRVKDSDQVVGDYFALVFLALATADDNPRASEWLNKPWMGGLTATANDRSTARNTIRNYCVMSEGGQWVEGTQYNQGTTVLLFMGAEGVKTATGVDHFPEVTRFARQMALSHIWEVTPDRTQAWAWGDVAENRGLRYFRRVTVDGILAGLTQDDPQSGPYIQQFVDEWIDQYGYTGGSMPWLRMFYFYNPYAPRADYRALPKGHFGPGQGHMFFHDGWGANDSFFGAHMAPKQLFVDHQVWTMGNFQLYRKGEWAVTHPIDYGGVDRFGEGTNSMLLAGLSSVWERKDVVAQEFGEAGDYAYAAATNGGQQYEPPYPYQPTVFLHEWSRSLLYLPSRDKHSDTIVVFDRVNAQNPKNLPKLNLYRPNDQALINNAAALKQWVIHMPVPPTQTEEGLTWQTAGGQGVKVSTLLPVGQRRTLIDEDELWPEDYSHPIKEEQKWQVRITPPVEQQWDTFLNVVQAFDAGTPLSSTLVRSAGGEAEGTLLRRETDPDTLVLFGAKAAGRVLTSGYRVSWTAVTAGADLFLMDLDPSRSWSVSVDGGAPAAVKVSGQGVGRLFVRGAGSHTLALSATGGAPADTAAPAVPSGVSATPGNAQVTVAWNSNSEPDLAGYYVYRSTAAAGTYARQNSTAIPARTLAQGGLTNGSTYWYKVCAADTSGNESALSAPISATPKAADTATFSVNGTVTVDGAGMSGATVTGGGKSATTSATGAYTLAGLAAGTHTVGASKSGYTFSAAKPVTVGPDQGGVDFSGAPVSTGTFTVRGKVTLGAAGLEGVTISGGGKTITSGADGSYALTGLAGGAHAITAKKYNYILSAAQNVTVGPDRSGVNFTATATFSVGGKVTLAGAALEGVTISAGGLTTTTNSNGAYILRGLGAGSYKVSAAKDGYTFSAPLNTTVGPNRSGLNFTATRAAGASYGISGKVTVDGAGLVGATVTAGTRSATTGADGGYTFTGLSAGSYALSAAKAGYSFSGARTVSVGPSATGIDFIGNATSAGYVISGRVTLDGAGLAGVRVAAGDRAASTGSDGAYALSGLPAGTYSVTASQSGAALAEPRSVTVGPDQSGVDFSARTSYSISGKVMLKKKPVAGITVLAGEQSATTDSKGEYVIRGLPLGTYTVRPVNTSVGSANYTFKQARSVTVGPSATGVNFAGRRGR